MIKLITRTAAPSSTLLVRAFVAADTALDGWRTLIRPFGVGRSRLETYGTVMARWGEQALGGFLLLSAAALLVGFFTRVAAMPTIFLAIAVALIHKQRIGGWGTATALDTVVWTGGVALCAIYLVIVGAGPWSIDQSLGRRVR